MIFLYFLKIIFTIVVFYGIIGSSDRVFRTKYLWSILFMKKKLTFISAMALSAALLVGCSTTPKATLSANWYADTSITNAINGTYEQLTYDVTYQSAGSSNKYYSVKYENGTYVTTLTNDIYTWKDGTKEEVYKLETCLTISGTYTMGTSSISFDDKVESVTYFRPVTSNLTPIYTEKHINSTSPLSLSPADAEQMCVNYNYSNYIVYEKDLSSATVTSVNHKKEDSKVSKTYDLNVSGSIFDNEAVLFAGRGINFISGSTNNSVSVNASVLSPEVGRVQTVNYAFSSSQNTKLTLNGKEVEIPTATVSLSLSEDYSGAKQTVVYAQKADGVNTYRNALVSMQTNLSYSLGSLVYTLSSATFTTK